VASAAAAIAGARLMPAPQQTSVGISFFSAAVKLMAGWSSASSFPEPEGTIISEQAVDAILQALDNAGSAMADFKIFIPAGGSAQRFQCCGTLRLKLFGGPSPLLEIWTS
jgi:hypothetical protein